MAYAVGQVIDGRYEVRQVLTPGGQGEVYVVFDNNEQVTGVLKLIDLKVLPAGAGVWDEARVLRRLADDHILPILNADSMLGQPYIVTLLPRTERYRRRCTPRAESACRSTTSSHGCGRHALASRAHTTRPLSTTT
jgi:hypothetical protein